MLDAHHPEGCWSILLWNSFFGIELLMTPGVVHRLIELFFTPSDCSESETHPIMTSYYSLSFPGAAGDFLGFRKINRIVFSAGKFNRIRCQTQKISPAAPSHWKFAPNISIKFASKLHFPWFASKISLLRGNSTVATRTNRSIAHALTVRPWDHCVGDRISSRPYPTLCCS